MADLRLVEPKTQKGDLYPRLDVRSGQGKSTLVSVKDNRRHTGGADCRQAAIRSAGCSNDGVYLRKPDIPQAWLAGARSIPREKSLVGSTAGFWTFLKSGCQSDPDPGGWCDAWHQPLGAPTQNFAVEDAPPDAKFKSDTTPAGRHGARDPRSR